jgi:type VI secretion system secreted protein Hcp
MADNFLKIDGIDGESTDDKHKNWIEILSYSFGVAQMASSSAQSATSSGTGGRADFQDLSIVKSMDKATPKIFLACAKGETIKEVTLELCKAGGDKQKYMEYKLSDVIISSTSTGGGGGGDPTESVTFNFGKIQETYTQINREGRPAGNVAAGWSLVLNKPL